MSKTSIKITSSEGHIFWVKPSFLQRCPNPSEYSSYDLINNWWLTNFLHNEQGPAVGIDIYWLDGQRFTKQDWHNLTFKTKLTDILDEEEP